LVSLAILAPLQLHSDFSQITAVQAYAQARRHIAPPNTLAADNLRKCSCTDANAQPQGWVSYILFILNYRGYSRIHDYRSPHHVNVLILSNWQNKILPVQGIGRQINGHVWSSLYATILRDGHY